VLSLVLSKKILEQLQEKHNIKLTDRQKNFMEIWFGKYIRPDWRMHDFEWGLMVALKLYPSPKQQPFFDNFNYEQLKLDSEDGSSS